MARAVLVAAGLGLLAACGQRGTTHADVARLACPASLDAVPTEIAAELENFRDAVETGPFLRAALRHSPRALRCSARIEGAAILLEYDCAGTTCVTARRDSTLELTEQRLVLPGLTQAQALALLRELESTAFGADGCGIDWSVPSIGAAGDARRIVYRGDVCNCSATIILQPGGGTETVFRSTC